MPLDSTIFSGKVTIALLWSLPSAAAAAGTAASPPPPPSAGASGALAASLSASHLPAIGGRSAPRERGGAIGHRRSLPPSPTCSSAGAWGQSRSARAPSRGGGPTRACACAGVQRMALVLGRWRAGCPPPYPPEQCRGRTCHGAPPRGVPPPLALARGHHPLLRALGAPLRARQPPPWLLLNEVMGGLAEGATSGEARRQGRPRAQRAARARRAGVRSGANWFQAD